MKYVALLRGINVGGNNIIKMASLKTCFEDSGYTNVITYIQSGNVIFESVEKDTKKLTKSLEDLLTKSFNYHARVIIKSQKQLEEIVADVPGDWKKRKDIRCYIAFLSDFITPKEAAAEIVLREDVDLMKIGNGCLYFTSLVSEITKSKLNKLVGLKVYKEMTMRNYNTSQKLVSLMA